MKLRVDYYSVSPNRFVAGTKGSYGFETMELEFSSEWEGLGKKIVFLPPAGESVSVIYEGEPIPIPYEVMSKRGVSRFAVIGSDGDKILLSVSGRIDVLDTLSAEANNSVPPTPDEMQTVLGIMEKTNRTARRLEAAANAGEFNGTSAGFGELRAELRYLSPGESPSVSLTTEGSDEAKNMTFSFALTEDPATVVKDARYSVRFEGANPLGRREDDAAGMVAEVATGDMLVRNDFDGVPFFQRRICCCTYSVSDMSWQVNAYLGEPGFDWYGGNGEVMYECRPFYYKIEYGEDSSPTFVSVAATQVGPQYRLAPLFTNPERPVYRPCFQMGLVDGKPSSRAGLHPHYDSLNGFMDKARLFDPNAYLETSVEWFSDALLLWVEFATKDWQSILPGATTMVRGDEEGAKVIQRTGTNTIKLDRSSYADGQYIAIGNTLFGSEKGEYLQLKAYQYNTDNTISFQLTPGPSSTVVSGDYVSSRMWKTGEAALQVKASSGIRSGNDLTKMPFIWRGKENPWGNGAKAICDVLVTKDGDTAEYHYLSQPQGYYNGEVNYNYSMSNLVPLSENGYIANVGTSKYDYSRLFPTALGGSSSTHLCSAYRAPMKATNGLYMGGDLSEGADAGFLMDFSHSPDESWPFFSARFNCLQR